LSEIRANTISAANGTDPVTLTKQSAAKAWVNFNGTGTAAIRGSQGVSGLVDNGTGRFSVNFTNAMSNANYAAVTSGGSSGSAAGMGYMYSPSTTATGVEFVNANDDLLDPVYGTTDVNGDLA